MPNVSQRYILPNWHDCGGNCYALQGPSGECSTEGNNDIDESSSEVMSTLCSVLNKSSPVAEMGNHLATTDMGRKVRAAVPFSFPWGSWLSPHLTQYTVSPGTRSTSQPSGILIHPAVWP